ncbi:MAG: M28 family peptidase [Candidatus Aminicenantales bacterium]
MRKIVCLSLVVFILISPALARKKQAEKTDFDEKAALSYIETLASDALMGRRSGQPGGKMTEEYIASKLKEWGVEPAGNDGTYFQNFTIEHRNIEQGVALEIFAQKGKRSFYYGEDWRVQSYSGSGSFMSEIVFVGYGIHAPEKEYDDYEGVDLKGKVALLASGTPQKLAKKLEEKVKMEDRVRAARESGACGVLIFRRPGQTGRFYGVRLKKEIYDPDFVIIAVDDRVTEYIFKELKTELRYLLREIERTSKPMSFATGVKAFVSVRAIFDEKRPTRNVLGKITGTDKNLRDEYVIIGAHMDHLGVSPLGDVYNGANDNASGTAVVMEVAREMVLNKERLPRTVVFALWAGEEQGLLGSRHYAQHPLFPLEKTVAYLNMDMVGHGNGKVNCRGRYYAPEIWNLLKENVSKETMEYVNPGRGGPGGSDHTPFLMEGVPAFAVMTSGYHFKYHRNRDDSDLIKPEILKKTGNFVHQAVKVLASQPGDFILPLRKEMFYLKYQTLINFELSPLENVIEKHGQAKDSHVNLQLAVVKGKEELRGDALRVDIIEKLFHAAEKIKKSKGLTLYSSSGQVSRDMRAGKTTMLTGLEGADAFRDKPLWTEVLAKQGIYFVFLDKPAFLFSEEKLSEEGEKIIKALNRSGMLPILSGVNEAQMKIVLDKSKKPLVFLCRELPSKEMMKLIKEKNAALGLIMGRDEEAPVYFKKLDEAKKTIGSENLMFINELCLWGEEGKNSVLHLFTEILAAKYEREEIRNIFSSTFLRVLRETRNEAPSFGYAYIPF